MAIALFGGTFNPVHLGHLRIATELAELLDVDEMRLIPCAIPPLREAPEVSAKQRMEMLELAIGNHSVLRAEDLELKRQGTSYTIDTVAQIRKERGDSEPLYLCIGMDSLRSLDSWHRWQELMDYCHIVVAARPESEEPHDGPVVDVINRTHTQAVQSMRQQACGLLAICELSMLPISSTVIREKIQQKLSIDYLTPQPVVDYIQQHHLYQHPFTSN